MREPVTAADGAKNPERARPAASVRVRPENPLAPGAPRWFDGKAILDRILKGERTEDIAKGFKVSRHALNFLLLKHAPEDWREAQVLRAIKRKEEAEDALDDAKDLLAFNKANAKLKSAQWDLERICRRIYGEVQREEQATMVLVVPNLRERVVGDGEAS